MAVRILATSTDRIQERVGDAYIHLLPLMKDEFPTDLQSDFDKLKQELTKVQPSGTEGSVKATTKVMTDDKAIELSKTIVSMYDEIARKYCS